MRIFILHPNPSISVRSLADTHILSTIDHGLELLATYGLHHLQVFLDDKLYTEDSMNTSLEYMTKISRIKLVRNEVLTPHRLVTSNYDYLLYIIEVVKYACVEYIHRFNRLNKKLFQFNSMLEVVFDLSVFLSKEYIKFGFQEVYSRYRLILKLINDILLDEFSVTFGPQLALYASDQLIENRDFYIKNKNRLTWTNTEVPDFMDSVTVL